jgi:hypothetical protein
VIVVLASCAIAEPQRYAAPMAASASFFMTFPQLDLEHHALALRFYMRWGRGRP